MTQTLKQAVYLNLNDARKEAQRSKPSMSSSHLETLTEVDLWETFQKFLHEGRSEWWIKTTIKKWQEQDKQCQCDLHPCHCLVRKTVYRAMLNLIDMCGKEHC